MTRPLPIALALVCAHLSACGPSAPRGQERPVQARSQATPAREPRPASGTATVTSPAGDPRAALPPLDGFERFLLTGTDATCPPLGRGDCETSVELLSDGTLRLNPWGEPGAAVLEAHISESARATAVEPLTAPALVALLRSAKPCPEANATESMLVRVAGAESTNLTGYCNEQPIQAVRGALLELTGTYFAGHSMITPPFVN